MRERERRAQAEPGYTTTDGVPQKGTVPVVVHEVEVVLDVSPDLDGLSKKDLMALAKLRGIYVASRWSKAEVLQAIEG